MRHPTPGWWAACPRRTGSCRDKETSSTVRDGVRRCCKGVLPNTVSNAAQSSKKPHSQVKSRTAKQNGKQTPAPVCAAKPAEHHCVDSLPRKSAVPHAVQILHLGGVERHAHHAQGCSGGDGAVAAIHAVEESSVCSRGAHFPTAMEMMRMEYIQRCILGVWYMYITSLYCFSSVLNAPLLECSMYSNGFSSSVNARFPSDRYTVMVSSRFVVVMMCCAHLKSTASLNPGSTAASNRATSSSATASFFAT